MKIQLEYAEIGSKNGKKLRFQMSYSEILNKVVTNFLEFGAKIRKKITLLIWLKRLVISKLHYKQVVKKSNSVHNSNLHSSN